MRTKEIILGAVAASLVVAFLPQVLSAAEGTGNPLPSFSAPSAAALPNPADLPEDLVALARVETQSVVTVQCGNEEGSGWSAQVDLNSQLKASGYKSYLITNYHVVEGCLQNQSVHITLIDQSKVTGYLWAWDEVKDVAAIATSALIPALAWSGDQPANGWWVGILGSPLGFPGVLTEGIISSVDTSLTRATTSASINPGNSGGPAFDRSGRVIGLATAKYANSEGMGILNGTPLLCGSVIDCSAPSGIWNTASRTTAQDPARVLLASATVPAVTDNQLNQAAVLLLTSTRRMLAQSLENLNSAITNYPEQKLSFLKILSATPKDPVIDNSVDDVLEVALFANQVTAFMKSASSAISNAKVISLKPSPVVNTRPKSSTKAKTSATSTNTTITTKISDSTTKVITKPKTITCSNSFRSLRITAINAKCPLGFSLKTVLTL